MENSWGLLFYPKKPKHYSEGSIPVYMRITVDGVESELSIKVSTDPDKWCSDTNRISGKSDHIKALNEYMDMLHTKAIQARTELKLMNKPVTAGNVKLLVQGKPLDQHMIMDVFRDHNKKMAELVKKEEYAPGTLERYTTSYQHTQSFMQDTFNISDIDILKLDYTFISEYEHWLKTRRNCDHNTTMKYFSNFKKIVLICVKKRWLSGDPFGEFKMTKRKKRKKPLSQYELDRLTDKVFYAERLSIVRDIFLFSCYTGLAYADVKKLKRTDIYVGIDGYKWIAVPRKKCEKSDSSSNIPLLPQAEAIIRKYWNDPFCVQSGLALPVRSNQTMNEYLKEIADLCEIKVWLTFHLARHTFATTVTLANNVPFETVSRLLAHQNLAQTRDYAQVSDEKVSKDMLALRDKLSKAQNLEQAWAYISMYRPPSPFRQQRNMNRRYGSRYFPLRIICRIT